MVVPQGGMRVSRANQAARQQTARWRRSDQTSRRVFGRRMAEAVRPGIVALERNRVGQDRKRMRDAYRQGREAYGTTDRHEDTLVAISRHGGLRRTARHVACHLVHRVRRRHLGNHRMLRGMRGRVRHQRPGNRCQRKARDHQDREQPTQGEVGFHDLRLSQNCGGGNLRTEVPSMFRKSLSQVHCVEH